MQIERMSSNINLSKYSEIKSSLDSNPMIGKDENISHIKTLEEKRYIEDEIIKNIESANEKFIVFDRRFEFSIHEKTKQIMVKVIDVATDEIIREIPSEKILDLVAAIWEISGILIDEKI
ncbi:flagellar protein FlaG [Keratinibaculum paraultunense]|uniref:Flagellar protein FlaG n=1 Tax=Keratinibaculum paraultunense TaxID=1278232 RepID=A0A4R3L4G9_9FIRM|nr:flagellar protein FlaG [Keratinibaculum paraultunense]QQY80080.1 flagellar protein FlaG [Keratinibaculum paraultunense]TCS91599.1 flagellar protein FlaG [Keratinibaculum paraultunense]